MRLNKWKGRYLKVDNGYHKTVIYIIKPLKRNRRDTEVEAIDLKTKVRSTWNIIHSHKDWEYITQEQAIAELI